MYILVSWDIDPSMKDWAHVFTDFLSCLGDYKYLKVLSSTYIVKINSINDIEVISASMTRVIRANSLDSSYIISPEFRSELSALHLPLSVKNQLSYFMS